MGRALETDRLLLRPFRPEDRADCFAFLSDPETCHLDGGYEPFREMDRDYDALMEKLAGQEGRYMVEERASCRVVGTVHIFKDALRRVPAMEIGYVISPACRRRGYAAEAVERVIRYLFEETDTVLVTAGAAAGNAASLALLEKLGFTREGRIHKGFFLPGEGAVDLISFYRERNTSGTAVPLPGLFLFLIRRRGRVGQTGDAVAGDVVSLLICSTLPITGE